MFGNNGKWTQVVVLPTLPKEIRVRETSEELLTLFARRRDLMYQVGVVAVVAAALLHNFAFSTRPVFFGIETDSLVALFLFSISLLFCLRFIQIHVGIVYHGMRFALAEHVFAQKKVFADEQEALASSGRFNIVGVSILIVLFFAILAGTSTAVLIVSLQTNVHLVQALVGMLLVTSGLIGWLFFSHLAVAKMQKDKLLQDPPNIKTDPELEDFRSHYIASVATTHADMICITAMALLQALSVFTAFGETANPGKYDPATLRSGAVVLSLISLSLGAICLTVYWRFSNAITSFCDKLSWYSEPTFERRVSDTLLGWFVTFALFVLSVIVTISLISQLYLKLSKENCELVGLACGGVIIATALVFRLLKLRSKAAANDSTPDEHRTNEQPSDSERPISERKSNQEVEGNGETTEL